jgi:vitamin B12 transporter
MHLSPHKYDATSALARARPKAARAGWAGLALCSAGAFSRRVNAQPLAPQPNTPDNVEVRGSVLTRGSRDADVASSTVRGAALAAPGVNAAEILRAQTGVSVQETGGLGALATVQIRGATSAQTPVYFADIRLNDEVSGSADLAQVPVWLLSRVEVYRGNAPIEAGPGGIGGAIFLDPRRARGGNAGRNWEAALGALNGSFGTRGAWLRTQVASKRATAFFGLRTDRTANTFSFRDDKGTRFDTSDDRDELRRNADLTSTEAWAFAALTPAKSDGPQIDVLANQLEREQGIAGVGLTQNTVARMHTARGIYGARLRYPLDARWQLSANFSQLFTQVRLTDPQFELALGGPRAQLAASRSEGSIGARVAASDHWTLAARSQVERSALTFQQAQSQRDAARTNGYVSVQAQYRGAALEASDGLRLGSVLTAELVHTTSETKQPGTSEQPAQSSAVQVNPSARFSASYIMHGWTLTAIAGTYARMPTLGELYGFSGFVRGDPKLSRELGSTAEIGVRRQSVRIGAVVTLEADAWFYVRHASDLIAFRRSSLGYVVPYNVGAATVVGAEADTAFHLGRWVTCKLGASAKNPRASAAEGGGILPFQSVFAATLHGELALPRVVKLGLAGGTLDASYTLQSQRFADAAGLIAIPAQGNLTVALNLKLARGAALWSVRATNLLAEQRFDTIGYPLAQRAIYISLELAP